MVGQLPRGLPFSSTSSFSVNEVAPSTSAGPTVASADASVCDSVAPAFFNENAGLSRWTRHSMFSFVADDATRPVWAWSVQIQALS
jgi:hypothetical protein